MATKPEDKSEDKTEGASALFSAHLAVPPIPCELIHDAVNGLLHERCRGKQNHLEHCNEKGSDCPCKGGGGDGECREMPRPDVKPCISVSWGDSRCDCMETDDVEVLCITVCNCYTNITFSNFTINAVYVTDSASGPVPTLPDGTPSVEVTPLGPICFGDIGPCRDNEPGCVSRQVVLQTRGAKGGTYRLHLLGICYDVSFHYLESECFRLELCSDR